jgi:hypothetical protein
MDVIKTWPGHLDFRTIRKIVDGPEFRYFFSLGRGCPKQRPAAIWFTHHGRIMGRFAIEEIVRNVGQLPQLKRLDGGISAWQFKPDVWIAMCRPPFVPLNERLFYGGFRGWRYFDLDAYRLTLDAKVRL